MTNNPNMSRPALIEAISKAIDPAAWDNVGMTRLSDAGIRLVCERREAAIKAAMRVMTVIGSPGLWCEPSLSNGQVLNMANALNTAYLAGMKVAGTMDDI
jgi:hypothetical protein